MSIITTFPSALPELNDLLLGTKIKEEGNITRNFRIGEVLALIENGNAIPTSVNYGLFSQTAASQEIKNTTTVRSLVGNGVGSSIIPANTLSVGDSFSINASGYINCLENTVFSISILTNEGYDLANAGLITMRAATNKSWSLNANITVRSTGGPGVCSLITEGSFTYNKDTNNTPETILFSFLADEEISTTISNNIFVTAKWNTASLSNNIYSNIYNFTKTY